MGYTLVLFAFALNFGTAPTNIALGLAVLAFFVSGQWRAKQQAVISLSSTWVVLLCVGLVWLSAWHSPASLSDIVHFGKRYSRLLLIPIFVSMFVLGRAHRSVLDAFLLGNLIRVGFLLSRVWFGVEARWFVNPDAQIDWAFINPIPGSLFFVLGILFAGLSVVEGMRGHFSRLRCSWYWASFLVLLAYMCHYSQRRSGYVLLGCALVYLAWTACRLLPRARFWKLLGGLLIYVISLSLTGMIGERVLLLFSNAAQYQHEIASAAPAQSEEALSSFALRRAFLTTGLKIALHNPILGSGVGSVPILYRQVIDRPLPWIETDNLHNQYLMTAVSFGVVGIAMIFVLYLAVWRDAGVRGLLTGRRIALILVILMLVDGLMNSVLVDFFEGYGFCFFAAWCARLPNEGGRDS